MRCRCQSCCDRMSAEFLQDETNIQISGPRIPHFEFSLSTLTMTTLNIRITLYPRECLGHWVPRESSCRSIFQSYAREQLVSLEVLVLSCLVGLCVLINNFTGWLGLPDNIE